MTLVLDTNAWLWMTFASKRLGRKSRSLLEDPHQRLVVSAASVWEIVIKSAIGKLEIPGDVSRFVRDTLAKQRVGILDITVDHVLAVANLPDVHRDPFDRLIVAQVTFEGLRLLSGDIRLREYGVDFLDAEK